MCASLFFGIGGLKNWRGRPFQLEYLSEKGKGESGKGDWESRGR
jgi:hypothetical protein